MLSSQLTSGPAMDIIS